MIDPRRWILYCFGITQKTHAISFLLDVTQFIPLFNQYSLSIYYVPESVIRPRDTEINRITVSGLNGCPHVQDDRKKKKRDHGDIRKVDSVSPTCLHLNLAENRKQQRCSDFQIIKSSSLIL